GYIVEGLAQATAVINDDDTSLPKVSLEVAEAKTTEGSATPASITFTRTGSTAGSLAVNYTVGGTATAGADFAALSGSLVIPAGSASASLNITSADDNVAEQTETVIITIATSGASIADPV